VSLVMRDRPFAWKWWAAQPPQSNLQIHVAPPSGYARIHEWFVCGLVRKRRGTQQCHPYYIRRAAKAIMESIILIPYITYVFLRICVLHCGSRFLEMEVPSNDTPSDAPSCL
jgi:hypothetical protein